MSSKRIYISLKKEENQALQFIATEVLKQPLFDRAKAAHYLLVRMMEQMLIEWSKKKQSGVKDTYEDGPPANSDESKEGVESNETTAETTDSPSEARVEDVKCNGDADCNCEKECDCKDSDSDVLPAQEGDMAEPEGSEGTS